MEVLINLDCFIIIEKLLDYLQSLHKACVDAIRAARETSSMSSLIGDTISVAPLNSEFTVSGGVVNFGSKVVVLFGRDEHESAVAQLLKKHSTEPMSCIVYFDIAALATSLPSIPGPSKASSAIRKMLSLLIAKGSKAAIYHRYNWGCDRKSTEFSNALEGMKRGWERKSRVS